MCVTISGTKDASPCIADIEVIQRFSHVPTIRSACVVNAASKNLLTQILPVSQFITRKTGINSKSARAVSCAARGCPCPRK
jgi:hypothetical protein